MKKSTLSLLIVSGIVIVGAFAFFLTSNASNTSEAEIVVTANKPEADNALPQNSNINEQTVTTTYTIEQVAEHSNENDCWTIISGLVYDITAYIPRHPGGDEIIRACGDDGTTLFKQRTTIEGEEIGSGSPHSSNAANQLKAYQIGELSN